MYFTLIITMLLGQGYALPCLCEGVLTRNFVIKIGDAIINSTIISSKKIKLNHNRCGEVNEVGRLVTQLVVRASIFVSRSSFLIPCVLTYLCMCFRIWKVGFWVHLHSLTHLVSLLLKLLANKLRRNRNRGAFVFLPFLIQNHYLQYLTKWVKFLLLFGT